MRAPAQCRESHEVVAPPDRWNEVSWAWAPFIDGTYLLRLAPDRERCLS
jgi:hypothetical protein